VAERDFTDWNALADDNQWLWETSYAPRPLFGPWATWQAWLAAYRKIVREVQEMYGEEQPHAHMPLQSMLDSTASVQDIGFRLQHDMPGEALPEDWQAMCARQARILEDMFTRGAEAVTAVHSRPDRTPTEAEQLHTLISQSEQFLTTTAHQYIGLEHETASFQEVTQGPGATPPDMARQLHTIDQVTAALHANLTAVRQYLAAVRQAIEPHTTGA
jgi:hypothetical protein